MAKKKEGRPSWFKMFLHQKALVDAVPDDVAGKALKAVFRYFESGEVGELDPLAFAVFASVKPYIDESFNDYQRSSNAGRQGNAKRWNKGASGGDTPRYAPIPPQAPSTEVEVEVEADADTDADVLARALSADDLQTTNGAESTTNTPATAKNEQMVFEDRRREAINKVLNHH